MAATAAEEARARACDWERETERDGGRSGSGGDEGDEADADAGAPTPLLRDGADMAAAACDDDSETLRPLAGHGG